MTDLASSRDGVSRQQLHAPTSDLDRRCLGGRHEMPRSCPESCFARPPGSVCDISVAFAFRKTEARPGRQQGRAMGTDESYVLLGGKKVPMRRAENTAAPGEANCLSR